MARKRREFKVPKEVLEVRAKKYNVGDFILPPPDPNSSGVRVDGMTINQAVSYMKHITDKRKDQIHREPPGKPLPRNLRGGVSKDYRP